MSSKLQTIYRKLFKTFGPQNWWPGDTRFEIIVGAILTQNTNWGNVEKAINNLKQKKLLTAKAIKEVTPSKLSAAIKPAGFFNVKTKRLKNFINFLFEEYQGSVVKMKNEPLDVLRKKLLNVNGIGPETADSILLYACDKTVFVVDAYTKRIFSRHKFFDARADYDFVQRFFMENLKKDIRIFNEYHALIVRIAKNYCRVKPLCAECPLRYLFDEKKEIKN